MATLRRKIVHIDADKCDGCGLCASACHEGAIEIVEGKARLASESYCDGLGACLGECPRGAITIEERPAEAFDQAAVERRSMGVSPMRPTGVPPVAADPNPAAPAAPAAKPLPCGCPGTAVRSLKPTRVAAVPAARAGETPATQPCDAAASQLRNWPVQLALVPPTAPYLRGADLLVAADCVGCALPDFHTRLLAGKVLVVACPKLDDTGPQVAKLTAIMSMNDVRSVTVAHMEVPCCTGIVRAVRAAVDASGKDIPVRDVTVGIDGQIQER